jgi:hypothetical protein
MNTYQIHNQLAYAVRSAASLREELSTNSCSVLGRLIRRIRHAYLMSCIEGMSWRLRSRY